MAGIRAALEAAGEQFRRDTAGTLPIIPAAAFDANRRASFDTLRFKTGVTGRSPLRQPHDHGRAVLAIAPGRLQTASPERLSVSCP
jgi:hypothetical protein